MLHYSAVICLICFLTHLFVILDYHDINLDKKFNQKQRNTNDSQKNSLWKTGFSFKISIQYGESLKSVYSMTNLLNQYRV